MKINRDARQKAKKLFAVCHAADGQLDAARVRLAFSRLAAEKPRNYLPILARMEKLVAMNDARTTAIVESPAPLGAEEETFRKKIAASFGPHFRVQFKTQPNLLAGVRIKVGNDVFDGSVRGRLAALEQSL